MAEDEQQAKKRSFRQSFRQTKKKPEGNGAEGHFSGLGAKLMGKMGWKKGEGLGASGDGIAAPIEVKLRNTKGGVGAVSELSEQQRKEARRRAKRDAEERGEVYLDSSEEERQRRKRRKVAGGRGTGTGASTPSSTPRPKKTIYDLKAAGFEVPLQLQSIVDATGTQVKTSSLSLRGKQPIFQTSLAGKVQRELAAFADAAEAVESDAQNIDLESERLAAELKALERDVSELADIRSRIQELPLKEWPELVEGLKSLRKAYPSRSFEKEAIAAIRPTFEKRIVGWDPVTDTLEDLAKSLEDLSMIDPSSGKSTVPSHEVGRIVLAPLYPRNEQISRRSTTPYESLMLSWFAHLQTAMVHGFQPDSPSASSFLRTFDTWFPVLPAFIKTRISKQIKLRCSTTIDSWNVRKAIKHRETPLPQWIFDFLPYYPDIFTACKGKLRTVLEIWPIHRGVIPGMQLWRKAFPGPVDQMLVKHLLPRLAEHLRSLEIDPADQKLDIVSAVVAWKPVYSAKVIAELLHSAFFPNFYSVLHSWSSYAEAQYAEIGTWVQWWKDETLGEYMADLESDWIQAYNLINAALDILDLNGDNDTTMEDLPLPNVEPERAPRAPETPQPSRSRKPEPGLQDAEDVSFKDYVDSWCAEQDLLLMPLRKKDETTGMALFRIAASATGAGGIVVYFQGDTIFVQDKKDKSVWDPVGLDEDLVKRAEGR
jgi:tuftelin-interacting protein 11